MLSVTCPNPSCPRKWLRVRPEDVQTARQRALRVRCRRCGARFVLSPEEVRETLPREPKRPLWDRVAGLLTETFRGPEEPGASDVAPAEDPTSGLPSTGQAAGQPTIDHAPDPPAPTVAMPGWIDSLPDAPRPSGARGRKLDAEPIPTRIGRFEVRAFLGGGGFGRVYRCYDTQLERQVAVKVPHRGTFETPALRQRFFSEARSAAQLHHPHIVPIYEPGLDNDRPYIVFAFIEGSTLADARDQRRLDQRRAVAIVRDLAGALAYAHRLDIVHRDVKPANVLLDGDDGCHLADFGLARRHDPAAETGREQEAARVISGTPAYMAPEQWRGEARAASDQYSLGVVLYELLCHCHPFDCPHHLHHLIRYSHEKQPPPSPRSKNPALPLDLEAICLKTLAKRPEERYGDCQELADDLRRWLEGEPVKARPLGLGERLLRWCRREPALASSLGFALTFLLAFALLMFHSAARERELAAESERRRQEAVEQKDRADEATELAEQQRQEAEQRRKEAEEQKRQALRNLASSRIDQALDLCEKGEVGQGLVRLAKARDLALEAEAPDLVRVIDTNLAGWRRQVHALRKVLPHPDKVTVAAYGKGGRVVAAASGPHVWLWDVRSGERLPLGFEPDFGDRVAALAFGGLRRSLLLIASVHGDVYHLDLWDLDKPGAPLASYEPRANEPILSASLSPDGETVLMGGGTEGRPDGWARLWVPGLMRAIPLAGIKGPVYSTAFSRDGTQCLTGGGDRFHGAAQVWDVPSGRALGPPLVHDHGVTAAAFSPSGAQVLTGTRGLFEGEAQLWDVADGRRQGPPLVSGLEIFAVAFSPDGGRAAIGGQDRAVHLVDMRSRQQIGSLLRHARDVNSVAFSPNGRLLLTAGDDGTARLWQLSPGLVPRVSCRHLGPVLAAAYNPKRKLFCTGAAHLGLSRSGLEVSGQAWVWDGKSDTPRYQLPHPKPVSAVAWHPDGTMLLTGCWDGKVRLWDLPAHGSAVPLREIAPELPAGRSARRVQALAFSPDGNRCAAGWYDGWLEVHDSALQDPPSLKGPAHQSVLYAIAFSPDGCRFATASQGRTVQQWKVQTGKRIGEPMWHPDAVLSVVYSADGEQILSGFAGGARLWRAKDGRPLGVPFPHQAGVFGVAFGPGPFLLTGGTDRLAHLWDIQTGKPLGPAFPHGGAVMGAAFLDQGAVLTAGLNWYAHVWPGIGLLGADPKQVVRWTEVITGIQVRADGTIGILEPDDWQKQQRELKEPSIEEVLRREAAERPEPVVPPSQPNPNALGLGGVGEGARLAPRRGAEQAALGVLEVDMGRLGDWYRQQPDVRKQADVRKLVSEWDGLLERYPLLKEMEAGLLRRIERFTLVVSGSWKEPRITVFLHGDFDREALHARFEQQASVHHEPTGRMVYHYTGHYHGRKVQVLAAFADKRTLVLSTSDADLHTALDGGEEGVTLRHQDFTLPRRRLKDREGLAMTVMMTEEGQGMLPLPELKETAGHLVGLTLAVDLPDAGADVHLSVHARDQQAAEEVAKLFGVIRQQDVERAPALAGIIKGTKLWVEGKTARLHIPIRKEAIAELAREKQE